MVSNIWLPNVRRGNGVEYIMVDGFILGRCNLTSAGCLFLSFGKGCYWHGSQILLTAVGLDRVQIAL